MTSPTQRFFETDNQDLINKYENQGITPEFKFENKSYYLVQPMNYLPPEILEDDADDQDWDATTVYDEATDKMEQIAALYIKDGFVEVDSHTYKTNEKASKERKQKSFLDNFSQEERYVYDKTKEYINEYDLSSEQVSFLISLRPLVVKGITITTYILEEQASKAKKQIDDIFDAGNQDMICEHFNKLAEEVKSLNKPKVKP